MQTTGSRFKIEDVQLSLGRRNLGLPHLVKIIRSKDMSEGSDITVSIDMPSRMREVQESYVCQRTMPSLTSMNSNFSDDDQDVLLAIRENRLRYNPIEIIAVENEFTIPSSYFVDEQEIFTFADGHEFQPFNIYEGLNFEGGSFGINVMTINPPTGRGQ
ncbi:uncharacterized protein Ecym_5167 [Eremothecium cymbalariae DBVPG|uniref:Uncharacterized protein n=1 Tax=Eremothecium cymbalariae (strain CBS 270.75 / DBVPG 7215 / KCTC 17166 / NRRL Y-17582) TaxID=931890 RepID=I6NCZ9_ERECY|nr:hypothetical protein Ecym_5167 [Eremothecium cymbalariae DBVPG\